MIKKYSNQSGQTLLEYLLLTAVVISMFLILTRSQLVKNMIGEDGLFMDQIQKNIQFCYRHAFDGKKIEKIPADYINADHQSYHSGIDTRFFGPADPYPVR